MQKNQPISINYGKVVAVDDVQLDSASTGGATLKVIQDLADIRIGDCVSVEQGQTANIRRVNPEMCVQGPHLQDQEITRSHADNADECSQAKHQVLNASTDAEFARAERRVQILCH